MKCIVNALGVISDTLEGPLAAYIGSFSKSVSDQGYTLDSVNKQTRIAAFFSRWLKQKAIRSRNVSTEHATRFLQYRARRHRPYLGDPAALRRLIEFLRSQNVIPAQNIAPTVLTPVERCVQSFEQYLREERALAEQRSSTMCLLSAIFSRIVSATDKSRSLAFWPAML
jgi:integrase/recombinase XerD